nr:hypothetical protein BaRGS_017215 [Batillaria attramentaria]
MMAVVFLMLLVLCTGSVWALIPQILETLSNDVENMKGQIRRLEAAANTHVAFHAEFSTDNVPLTPGATYVLDRVVTNIGDGYDRFSGHFVAPVSGTYMFVVNFMGPRDTFQYAYIVVDGRIRSYSISHGDGTAWDQASGVLVIRLNAGQRVWLKRSTEASRTKIVRGSHWTTFSGFLIHV